MITLSEQQTTTRSAGMIGLLAFGGAFVGFFLQLLVAYYFGASTATDAYFMAFSTSELLGKILLGGSVTAVFLPIFIEKLTQGDRHEAWRMALNLFHVSAIALLALLLLLAFFTRPFVEFIAPGFDATTTMLTVDLLRVLLPAFFFYFLADLAVSMLHALKMFFVPALLRIIAPLVPIGLLLMAAPTLGIYALALGTTISAALQFVVVARALSSRGFHYRMVLQITDPFLRRLLFLVYPFLLSMLVTQLAGIVYRILVSELTPGSLSALKYAEKVTQLITIICLNSVTAVVYPLLSEKVSQRELTGVRDTLAGAVRLTTFLTVPIIIGIGFLHSSLIEFIYAHGSFTNAAAELTSGALVFLGIGLSINAISSILGHAVLAFQKSRVAVAVTITSQAVALYLFVLLVPRLGHIGLALASSLVPLASGLLYFLYLRRLVPRLGYIFWHPTYLKIIVLSAALSACLLATKLFLGFIPSALYPTYSIWTLFLPSLIGAAVFFGGAQLWHIGEMQDIHVIMKSIFKKWKQQSPPPAI